MLSICLQLACLVTRKENEWYRRKEKKDILLWLNALLASYWKQYRHIERESSISTLSSFVQGSRVKYDNDSLREILHS